MILEPRLLLIPTLVLLLACPPLIPLLGFPFVFFCALKVVMMAWRRTPGVLYASALVGLYLGFLFVVSGILVGLDTPFGGTAPTRAEKRFGIRLAYVGGGLSALAAVAAFMLSRNRVRAISADVKNVVER